MVDFLVYGSVQSRKAVSAEEIPAVITSEVLNQVKRQTLVGVHSPHLNQPTKNQLVANFLAVLERALAAGVEQSEAEALKAGLQSILENLPWTCDAAEANKDETIKEL